MLRAVKLAVLLSLGLAVAKPAAQPAMAQPAQKSASPPEFAFEGSTKRVYKQTDTGTLHLHIFKPDGWSATDRRAAIVFFFGGGWVGGTPAQFVPQCEYLAKRGMVALTAEYRVKSRHGAHPADCVADAQDAVRWVRHHANELGVDNARIAVSGGSAGGHLAASTATLESLPEEAEDSADCTPSALVLYNPVCDTTLRGYGGERLGDRMYELSPVHHIGKRMPPTLIFHGRADRTVPFENALRFKQLMDEQGNACELVPYPGAGHGFFNPGRKNNQYDDTTRRLDEFLTKLGFVDPPNVNFKVAGRTLQQWRDELHDADVTKQRRAAESIGQFGALASDSFLTLLDHEDAAIRYVAASHIGDHQTPKSAIGKLRQLIDGPSRGVKIAAAYALCRLGEPESGLPVFESMLGTEERGLQCSAADFLCRIGSVAKPLLESLEKKREATDYHVKNGYINAMKWIAQDESFIEYKRPQGGGKLRGWNPSSVGNPVAQNQRPNILWISCEDISPNLGCYGDAYARTPNLDELASQGVRFDRAFTPAGVCAVVRSSLITGVYAISQGSQHMRSRIELPVGVRCFPEYLRAAGYFCTNKSKTDYQFEPPETVWDRQGNDHNDWRDRADGQPFFSVINLTISHESQIRHGEQTHAALLERLSVDQRHDPDEAAKYLPPFHANTPEARKDWAWYSDNISEMDRQAGLILQQLEDDGLADNTIVVFWGDHGRGLPRGKRWIYDSGVRVPMIVRWPGYVGAGTARGDLVSTQDLPPTMLSLAGLTVPDYFQGRVMLGPDSQPEPEYLFAHRDRMDEAYELQRSARDHRFRYIRNYHVRRTYAQNIQYMNMMPTLVDLRRMDRDGQLNLAQSNFFRQQKPAEELYDLERDPHETVNLAWLPEHAERVAAMRAALEAWQQEIVDLGHVPEPIMMEQMRPGDEVRKVQDPEATFVVHSDSPGQTYLSIRSDTDGASIQYRTLGGNWKLYTGEAILFEGDAMEMLACRAGFQSSNVVTAKRP